MIRRPPRSTLDRSSAASDVYKRQALTDAELIGVSGLELYASGTLKVNAATDGITALDLSLIHISEPTRPY